MNNKYKNFENSISYDNFILSIHKLKKNHGIVSETEKYFKEKYCDVPKPPDEYNYWKNFLLKKGFYNFTKDEAKAIIDSRIDFLIDYYERLFSERLTDEEQNKPKPKDFKGPYLPTWQDIEKIKQMAILIDFEVPPDFYSAKVRKSINNKHREKLLNRWIQFQKEYKFYDLRPLIGCRCALLQRKEEELDFVFYQFLNKAQYNAFLIYMGSVVPELNFFQVNGQLNSFCDIYSNGKLEFNKGAGTYVSGFEFRLIYELLDRFGSRNDLFDIQSLLIGKRNVMKYHRITKFHILRGIPFTDKKWSKDEEIALMKQVLSQSGVSNLKSLLRRKEKVNWNEIGFELKLRKPDIYRRHYSYVKQKMLDAILVKENKIDESNLRWTPDKTVKLIELVYEKNVSSVKEINWYSMLEHFPGYTANFIGTCFCNLTKCRVPKDKRKNFEDVIEYLYHKIKPVYKLKDLHLRKRKCTLDLLTGVESSDISMKEKRHLQNYFNDNYERDSDDEHFATDDVNSGPSANQNFSSVENEERGIPLWEDINENDLKRGRMFQKKSILYYHIEDDELFWQEMMKRVNFVCNYSPELRKKLRCYVSSKYECMGVGSSDLDSTLECSATDSEFGENPHRYRDTLKKFRAMNMLSPKKYLFSNENKKRVAFGKDRKRSSCFKESSKHLNDNTSDCFTMINSESNNRAKNESAMVSDEIIILSSDDSCVEVSVESKSVKKRKKRIKRLNKRNKNSLENSTSNNNCLNNNFGTSETDLVPKRKTSDENNEERLNLLVKTFTDKKEKVEMSSRSGVADKLSRKDNNSEEVSFIKKKKKKKKTD